MSIVTESDNCHEVARIDAKYQSASEIETLRAIIGAVYLCDRNCGVETDGNEIVFFAFWNDTK